MNTKKLVLAALENERGRCVSGAAVAQTLGVTRNAVWKAVRELKKDGYKISAVTNGGYTLCVENDILSAEGMRPFLIIPSQIFVHETLESTNITAKEMAVAGAAHGTVVIANAQTAGQGRYGRKFYAPAGCGVYMSFVLRPEQLNFTTPTLLTAFAAVCVCKAVEAVTDKKPQVKWVNDIFLNGKKICGISTEAVTDFESGNMSWIVLGIGVNFTATNLPDELKNIVGSVFEGGVPTITRNRLAAEIINRVLTCANEKEMLGSYKQRLMVLGKKVSVTGAGAPYEATPLDIDDIGRLIVQKPNGEVVPLAFGEVSIVI